MIEIDQLLSFQMPGLWLLLTAIVTVLLLVWRQYFPGKWERSLWIALWLLIPYFGLLMGGLSPRLMGLIYIDWSSSLSLGFGLIFIVIALLTLVRMTVALPGLEPDSSQDVQSRTAVESEQERRESRIASSLYEVTWRSLGVSIALSGVEEFHRAFLRGSLWEILLILPNPPELPAYWAIWFAAAIASVETLFHRPSFARWLFQNAILVTTSILFFYTRNFWLCWFLNAVAQLIAAPYGSPQLLALEEKPGVARTSEKAAA